ncbi:MAG: DUF4349 domain-containing protein [Elainellaceae cyanobacterium]
MNQSSVRSLWLGPVLGVILLTSCGSATEFSSEIASEAQVESAPAADGSAERSETTATPLNAPAPAPQLAKDASITLRVDAVAEGIDQAVAIARQQQGDILTLEDSTPDSGAQQQAFLRVRVPQSRLEATLDALADLGTVQQRQITAEDVSTQLVDLDARLRNLRKTEELLLGIMERSGEVADVLKVAQEVSNVRASIEQIDAQLQQLSNRVSYSTVSIRLESAIAASAPPIRLQDELSNTWQRATLSFRNLSVTLVKLLMWLLVYSPYLALILLVGVGLYRLRRRWATTDRSAQDA